MGEGDSKYINNIMKIFDWANFNKTWHKASLGEVNSTRNEKIMPYSKQIYTQKYFDNIKKNLLLKNHQANINQT